MSHEELSLSAKDRGISEYAFEQALKLENTLHRIDIDETTLQQLHKPYKVYYHFENGRHEWMDVSSETIQAQKHIAAGLYEDLLKEGEKELADDLVIQAREDRIFLIYPNSHGSTSEPTTG